MAMSELVRRFRVARLFDASVVTAAADIAGARHEVLPPRRYVMGGVFLTPTSRAAPP